jgi:DNA-binding CsgD family transcriptional regulator
MSKDTSYALIFLLLVALFIGLDIGFDLEENDSTFHIAIEFTVLTISVSGFLYIFAGYLRKGKENADLKLRLDRSIEDTENWKKETEKLMGGLGRAIDSQFRLWSLTRAEKEVGLLLLKGLSFKEIATVRNTAERTARQQSLEIYKKSGLAGRGEFSAFFLEDLLLPVDERESE